MLKRIFEPKKNGVTWEWKRVYNEEFYDLYSSTNIIRVTKPRMTRWLKHVARTGNRRA
jgi:hypothetical protein